MGRGLARAPKVGVARDRFERIVDRVVPPGAGREAWRGRTLGHALHPVLSDLPIGCWTSAGFLDLVGGASSRKASKQLIGLGIIVAVPTALSGAAEWSEAPSETQRVGVLHASANGVALALYVLS